MIPGKTGMKTGKMGYFRGLRVLLLWTVAMVGGSLCAQVPVGLDADRILELARSSYVLQDHELQGKLRQDRKTTSFRLTMQEGMIRFKFDNPQQIIHLEIHDEGSLMREVVAGSDAPVAPGRYSEAVRGTDMCYEDLAMRFLYWPNPRYLGDEKVSKADCWKLLVKNPGKVGPYSHVVLWIDKGSGGLAQMLGLDESGKVLRRFLVRKVQKIDGAWVLKEMRIERFSPAEEKVLGRTYLTLDELGPKKNPYFKK